MQGIVTWTPSPSTNAIAQDLLVYINVGGGPVEGILPKTSTYTIQGLNTGDTYDIYVVTYSAGGAQRAPSAHLTGVVPGVTPPETLLPATGLSISFV
jgi:hypothetical protein